MAEPTVFVVDDDPAVRDSLSLLFRACGQQARCFASADAFLDAYCPDEPGCLIVDLQMPGLSGLELQAQLKLRDCELPLIFLTGHGDVPAAVRALKEGAIDFVQKPFDAERMVTLVEEAIDRDGERRATRLRRRTVEQQVTELTPREREVMREVVAGHANKVIALELGISERTVELHRSRLMKKMDARSVPELMRMLQVLEE